MADEGTQGGDNGNSGGDDGDTAQLQTEITTLKTQLGELETAKSEQAGKIKEYEDVLMSDEYAKFVESEKDGGGTKATETPKEEDITDLEKLNSFAPGQLAEFLSNKFGERLGEAQAASNKKLEELTSAMVGQLARINLEFTKVKHSDPSKEPGEKSLSEKLDTKDYYDHFMKVATENPNWDGEKVYKLVEMEIATEAHSQKQKEEAKEALERKTLTEKATETPLSTVKGKRLDKDQAVDLAYDQTFGTSGVATE